MATIRRNSIISALYRPWIVRACRIRSIPAAVGPVLLPPCIRHREFLIAGDRHELPLGFLLRSGGRTAPRELSCANREGDVRGSPWLLPASPPPRMAGAAMFPTTAFAPE